MTQKSIEYNLRNALLNNGKMVYALYEYELKEHIKEFLESKKDYKNDYLIAVTENNNHVAMVFIDSMNNVYVNEEARNALEKYWKLPVYKNNMQKLIPTMAKILSEGNLFVTGINEQ